MEMVWICIEIRSEVDESLIILEINSRIFLLNNMWAS